MTRPGARSRSDPTGSDRDRALSARLYDGARGRAGTARLLAADIIAAPAKGLLAFVLPELGEFVRERAQEESVLAGTAA